MTESGLNWNDAGSDQDTAAAPDINQINYLSLLEPPAVQPGPEAAEQPEVIERPAVPPGQAGFGGKLRPGPVGQINQIPGWDEGNIPLPRLRAGVDFDAPVPVAANLIGDSYLQAMQDRLPLQVRENIARLIHRLESGETRNQAQLQLREYGPTAVPALIAELGSADSNRSQRASDQLRLMGDAALPGLLSTRDGRPPAMPGQRDVVRDQIDALISELGPDAPARLVHDAQGRLRRQYGKINELLSVNYDAQGRISDVSWGYAYTREGFQRQHDGSFLRSNDNSMVHDLTVGDDGRLSFRVGAASVQWSPAGSVEVTGAPVTSNRERRTMTVPVQIGGRTVDVSVLPRGEQNGLRTLR